MKKLLTIIISCCFLSGAFAQGIERQVISSGGGNGASGSKLLSYTIGETVVKTASLTSGNPFYQGFQMPRGSVITNFQLVPLSVTPRWNYISSYINTTETMQKIFMDSDLPWAASSGITVINKAPDPGLTLESAIPGITNFNWDPYRGYQLYLNSGVPDTLKFVGEDLTYAKKFFKHGWNMIPMLVKDKNITTQDFFEAAANDGKAFLIRGINGEVSTYFGGTTVNNFTMIVGKAYDVYFSADAADTLDYTTLPTAAKSSNVEFAYPQTVWEAPVANINAHSIIVPDYTIRDFEYGDVLAAFNNAGYCAGMGVYTGTTMVFVVNAENLDLDIQGLSVNEEMTFKLYRPTSGETFDVALDFDSKFDGINFVENGISVVKGTCAVEGIDENRISDVTLYPNPANSYINISISGNASDDAQVYIIGMGDGRVYNQFKLTSERIDVSQLPNGVYSLKVVDAENVIVKKFVKQ